MFRVRSCCLLNSSRSINPDYSGNVPQPIIVRSRDYHPLRSRFSTELSLDSRIATYAPNHTCPLYYYNGFVLPSSGFSHPYLRNHYCFLFLWLLRCFNSPRSCTKKVRTTKVHEVALRNPSINVRMQLHWAYRSLPRPSSALKPSHSLDGVLPLAAYYLIFFYSNLMFGC